MGYWDYDTVRFFERLPESKEDALGFPTGAFQLTGDLVVLDRFSQVAQVISNVYLPKNKRSLKDLKALYAEGVRSIERQIARIQSARRRVAPQEKPKLKAAESADDAQSL